MSQPFPAEVKPLKTVVPSGGSEHTEFLAAVGKRLRELREQRGMARKLLAKEADVSERYLAQLEAGEGNVSIVLLRRIALALGVQPEDIMANGRTTAYRMVAQLLERFPEDRLEEVLFHLIHDLGARSDARKQRIALMGLRGAGKSTLGRLLAKELHVPFVELDSEVEREAGMALSEVFLLYGQGGYRRMERRCLERVIETHPRAVLSVGGGIVSEPETFNLLLADCFTVWLKASPEEHMTRVAAQGDLRPMQDNEDAMEDLRRILTSRASLYARADAQVDTSGQKPEESLAKLRQAVAA
jgi:XRE family transcriptional regulator, aerobic/anaerobic benzoate catabolism transcriptional regulator